MRMLILLTLIVAFALIANHSFAATYNAATSNPDVPHAVETIQPNVHTLILHSHMIKSAYDIEVAIHTVTEHCTQGGTLQFDGIDGPFIYHEGLDRTINIDCSKLTIQGIHQAFFPNTDIGFILEANVHEVVIKDLVIYSKGPGLLANGIHNQVTAQGNMLRTGPIGIQVDQGQNWLITQNTIDSTQTGISIASSNNTITENRIMVQAADRSAPQKAERAVKWVGISLNGGANSIISNNTIVNADYGIRLDGPAHNNAIQKNNFVENHIFGVFRGSIGMINPVESNNQLFCSSGATCFITNQ